MRVLSKSEQEQHYREIMVTQRGNRNLFSCGYEERFDPFLLRGRPALTTIFETMFAELFPQPAGRLLDIGCGSGFYLPLLSRFADEIIGFDLSPEMVAGAGELIDASGITNVRLFVGDAEQIDLPDGTVDCILCFDVLHHIPDLPRALAEMHRLLCPGGRLIAIEPNVLNPAVFAAHAMPAEERGAVMRNWPWGFGPMLAPYFEGVHVRFINYVASSSSEFISLVLSGLTKVMARTPLRVFSMRQIVTGTRRAKVGES